MIAILIAMASGCGQQSTQDRLEQDQQQLQEATQNAQIAGWEEAFSSAALADSEIGVDRHYLRSSNAVDALIALCRENPDATYDGRTMRQVVEDGANTLRGVDSDLSRSLQLVASNGCQ